MKRKFENVFMNHIFVIAKILQIGLDLQKNVTTYSVPLIFNH